MSWESVEAISRLLWYSECKRLALDKIAAFVPPADSEEMRMYHSLYITNLFSLLDLAAEMFGSKFLTTWESTLNGIGGYSGAQNYLYLRELRNAVIHRGEDITATATLICGKVCVCSPLEIYDRKKSKPPLVPVTR